MIVCHCRGVSDRVVRNAIVAGATDVDEVGLLCGAGTECGGCQPRIRRLLLAETPVLLTAAS